MSGQRGMEVGKIAGRMLHEIKHKMVRVKKKMVLVGLERKRWSRKRSKCSDIETNWF
jgi:hypothetical protein